MLILALDTATPATTVAVHDGTRVLAESAHVDPLRHAEVLAPAIEAALNEAGCGIGDLTRIGVGVGPGPFTGLRVGLVTAQTVAAVHELPVHGVCTLDVLAAAAELHDDDGGFLVVTDARRKEVYWARYADRRTRLDGPHVTKPDEVGTTEPVVGRGGELYPDAFPHRRRPIDASAGVLAELVAEEHAPALPPRPLYLRRPDAATPGARKRVLTR